MHLQAPTIGGPDAEVMIDRYAAGLQSADDSALAQSIMIIATDPAQTGEARMRRLSHLLRLYRLAVEERNGSSVALVAAALNDDRFEMGSH